MEAVLFKGASVGLESLQALKGTAFLGKIEGLAQTTKQAIAEVKVPVKATSEVIADTAGGTRKVLNIETKPIGEILQNIESRAKEVLSSENVPRVKPINLPAWEKLTFRIDPGETKPHFLTGHKTGENRLVQSQKAGGKKDVFPESMTDKQIINAIKTAYNNSKKIGTQVDLFTGEKRVELIGQADGMKIKMYVNVTTKTLESAFPQ
jgi:hypothetical protein